MKSSRLVFIVMAMLAQGVFAGPAEKRDPVAEGFPDWYGLTDANCVSGRNLATRRMKPSDLRHKVVVVVEADPSDLNKFHNEQLPLVAQLARFNACFKGGFDASLGTLVSDVSVPRSTVVLISLRGKRSPDLLTAFASKANDVDIRAACSSYCPIYYDAGMVGEPENAEGKYPFAYVLDGKSSQPVWKGAVTAQSVKEIGNAVQAARKGLPEWTSLTGVAEPQTQKTAFKQIKDGKFTAAQKTLLSGIRSKDPATAAEAQKMYDAIEQYQSDEIHLIESLQPISPALAYSELMQFARLFPAANKDLAGPTKAIKGTPGAQQLGEIVAKFRLWSSAGYQPKNAAEVKKNVAEVGKWKKALAQLENSQNVKIQSDAMFVESQLEALQATLESKIAK